MDKLIEQEQLDFLTAFGLASETAALLLDRGNEAVAETDASMLRCSTMITCGIPIHGAVQIANLTIAGGNIRVANPVIDVQTGPIGARWFARWPFSQNQLEKTK